LCCPVEVSLQDSTFFSCFFDWWKGEHG
jgi:hypothetical protein